MNLDDYLRQYGIPGLQGVDTRAITKKLRVTGAMKCCLSSAEISDEEAVRRAQAWEGLVGVDFVKEVTCQSLSVGSRGSLGHTFLASPAPRSVPGSPPRSATRSWRSTTEPNATSSKNCASMVSTSGWCPPAPPLQWWTNSRLTACFFPTVPAIRNRSTTPTGRWRSSSRNIPTFGICMGNHMITHALGAKTFKLKFGHRGANQPVKNLETGKVSITAQNHGFAARPEDLERRGAIVTEVNLNDGTVEGLRHKDAACVLRAVPPGSLAGAA